MVVFATTEMYASPPTIDFNESKGIFVAEMMSRGQQIIIEGPSRTSVEIEIERTLYEEYMHMEQDLARGRQQSQGRSIGGSSSSGALALGTGLAMDQDETSKQPREKDLKNHNNKMGVSTWVELISSISAIVRGDWLSLALSGATLKLSGWMEDLSIFGSNKKIFSVSFGGILIVATSRKELRKKLTKERNKRIARIMNNVKFAEKERENASVAGGDPARIKDRLKKKKKAARVIKPNMWENKMQREGKLSPDQRKELMKKRLKGKRAIAKGMWVSRV